jgi:hypothetical protein
MARVKARNIFTVINGDVGWTVKKAKAEQIIKK